MNQHILNLPVVEVIPSAYPKMEITILHPTQHLPVPHEVQSSQRSAGIADGDGQLRQLSVEHQSVELVKVTFQKIHRWFHHTNTVINVIPFLCHSRLHLTVDAVSTFGSSQCKVTAFQPHLQTFTPIFYRFVFCFAIVAND